jgi:hypothetical protein
MDFWEKTRKWKIWLLIVNLRDPRKCYDTTYACCDGWKSMKVKHALAAHVGLDQKSTRAAMNPCLAKMGLWALLGLCNLFEPDFQGLSGCFNQFKPRTITKGFSIKLD